MKNILIFFSLLILFVPKELNAQFTDDFERYNYLQRVSPQSLNWITWSEDPASNSGYIVDEDGIITNIDFPNFGESQHFAYSGKQAMFIGQNNLGTVPQDVVLDLHNKSKGLWNLTWKMYIPKKKRAYYNFQEDTPINGSGKWAIQVYYYRNGKGRIKNDTGSNIVNFNYPQDEWFELKHTIDLDNDKIKIELISNSGTKVIYNANFLSNTQHLGGVDFYSVAKSNKYYIDDVIFEKNTSSIDLYIWANNRWEDINGNLLTGEPDSSYEVILKEPFNVDLNTVSGTLNCLNLILEETGNLIVPQQTNVIVSGDLTIPAANKIIVEDGGSFVMLNNIATINMVNLSSFEYIRRSAVMADLYDFTYWSSPVEGINISSFQSSAVYSYNTANFVDLYSGYGYPQTSGSPDGQDDNGDDWAYAGNSDNIIPGKGYAVLSPGISPRQTILFTGKPNNGFISIPVSLSGNNSNADDDWNLIGNPYPSAIDATVLINSNINISGTLYFWTHNTKLSSGNSGPADSNYNSNDYASFNLSGGVAASTGGEIPNGYIAAGQGFFMEVNNNGVVTFNNDMRVMNTVDENTQFYKTSRDKDVINDFEEFLNENKIWLSFTNKNGAFSQSLVAFLPKATNNYEANFDGIRADAGSRSKFYSILGDKELAIQGRKILTKDVKIPFGFYISKPEYFTISIDKLQGKITEENINIFLIDHELNKTHNLKLADYNFNVLESGTNNTRFTLQVTNSDKVLEDSNINNADVLLVTNSDNSFKINANQVVRVIEMYDMFGRLILIANPNTKNFYLKNHKIKKGAIVVFKVQFEDGKEISKKTIKY
jgi:hypothetical protein